MKVDPAATPLSNKSESAVEAVSPGGSTVLGPANEIPGGVEDGSALLPSAPVRERTKAAATDVNVKAIEELPDAGPGPKEEGPAPDLSMVRARLAMPESTVQEVEARFRNALDTDNDGTIDLPEFLKAMPELGQHSPALAKRLFAVFDHDNSGKIDQKEFVAGLSSLCSGSAQEKNRWVFALYDVDNDGFITKEELRALLKSYFGGKQAISSQAVECYDLEDVDFDAEESATPLPQKGTDSVREALKDMELNNLADDFVEQIFQGDKDADGKLSRDEFESWLEKEAQRPSAAGTATVKWVELLAGGVSGL